MNLFRLRNARSRRHFRSIPVVGCYISTSTGRSIRKMSGDGLALVPTWRRHLDTRCLSTRRCFQHCKAPYPQVRIVLSTSWVRVFGSVRKVAHRLPEALRARVVGATFHGDMDADLFTGMPRGLQLWADVRRRRPAAWLALDDQDDGWPDVAHDHLVLTDPVLGVIEPGVYRAIQANLAAMALL